MSSPEANAERAPGGPLGTSHSPARSTTLLVAALCLAVAVTTYVVHQPALSAKAISADDHEYLIDNALVRNPSWASAKRFLGEVMEPSTVGGYYQPLAMISLMMDCAMGGSPDNLRPFHRTNLLLHIGSTVLIIVLLYQLFGQPWPAALCGLLFAVHPLAVESLAWVAERKTMLATFFALGSMVAYVRYVHTKRRLIYAAAVGLFILALLSKPTTTPLPVLLLLLDVWPLSRLNGRAVLEKVPFFALAAMSAAITVLSQASAEHAGVERTVGSVLLVLCHNNMFYLGKIFWPTSLSSYYPYPDPLSFRSEAVMVGVIGTLVLLACLALSLRKTRALSIGWLFFFVAVFPTMGVVGFTDVIAADRFAYLPMLGPLLVIARLLAYSWRTRAMQPMGHILIVAFVLVFGGIEARIARAYAREWADTETLNLHMIGHAPFADSLRWALGAYYASVGRNEEAIDRFIEAVRLNPNSVEAHNNLGLLLHRMGRHEEAVEHLQKALALKPDYADVAGNLADALVGAGRVEEGLGQYAAALDADPNDTRVRINYAVALTRADRVDEAISQYEHILAIDPDFAAAHTNLANALARSGRLAEAVEHFERSVALDPDEPRTRNNLALALLQLDRPQDAVVQLREAIRLSPNDVTAHMRLGAALEQIGHLDEAIQQYERVLRIAPQFAPAIDALNSAKARKAAP